MRNDLRILDTDAHQMEPPSMWAEYIDPAFADRAPGIGDMGEGRKGMVCEGEPLAKQDGSYPMHSEEFLEASRRAMQRFERSRKQGFNPASRLQDMDDEGVDAQIIYPTVGGSCWANLSTIWSCWRPAAAPTTTGAWSTAPPHPSVCAWPPCCPSKRQTWRWKR